MTNEELDVLLDEYDKATIAVAAACRARNEVRKRISGLTFRQAQRIAKRGHWVSRPGHTMGWRPYQLLDDTKPNHFVGSSAKAWTRKDYKTHGLDNSTREALSRSLDGSDAGAQ